MKAPLRQLLHQSRHVAPAHIWSSGELHLRSQSLRGGIRPLPTLIGHVDPRRFWAFSLGRCALAEDGFYDAALGSLDSWKGPILHPPRTEAPASLGFFDEFGDGSSDDEDDRRGESVV